MKTTELNPHIVALRSAEQQLRDHDKRIADAAAELKTLKNDRVAIATRVAQCIDVLCGRAAPSLFETVEPAEPAAELPGPIVCKPVGQSRLTDVPGLTAEDIARLSCCEIHTLTDLGEECGGDLSKLAESLLEHWAGTFTAGDADRIQRALVAYFCPVTPEPKGVSYPATDKWRKQGLALLHLNEKLVKACKREEVLTVGELHDWIDEEAREKGGFFGPGVLADCLRAIGKIGKIGEKIAEANAEILYQFCADSGFLGVPESGAS
jgi:hypothetical protein